MDDKGKVSRMTGAQTLALVAELEKNTKLLSPTYCLNEDYNQWTKVVETVNNSSPHHAGMKDIDSLLKSWIYLKNKVKKIFSSKSIEKDLEINQRIAKLIELSDDNFLLSRETQPKQNRSNEKIPQSNLAKVEPKSDNQSLAAVGFSGVQNIFQKEIDKSRDSEVEIDLIQTLVDTNKALLTELQSQSKNQQLILTANQDLATLMKNMNVSVQALSTGLVKLTDAHNAVDFSLTMGFEAVASALKNQNRKDDMEV